MKDLIDRQVAIEAVCRGCSGNFYQECQAYHGKKTFCDQIKRLRAVPSAQGYADTDYMEKMSDLIFDSAFEMGKASAQRWIPVSERLPEYGEKVIVTKKVEGRPDMVDISYCYVQKEGFWSDTGFAAKVIAWMPLPEPYREVGNDG